MACLQVAFPETIAQSASIGRGVGTVEDDAEAHGGRPGLGALDAPVVVERRRRRWRLKRWRRKARLVCPKMYAHATAATALMSVKVLFKQPPWLYGLARAVNGKRSEMSEDERIGSSLWYALGSFGGKHIPSDPVQTIDAAPLMGAHGVR